MGADAAAGKQTYPALLGLDGARDYADELAIQAGDLARKLPSHRETWLALVDLFTSRES